MKSLIRTTKDTAVGPLGNCWLNCQIGQQCLTPQTLSFSARQEVMMRWMDSPMKVSW